MTTVEELQQKSAELRKFFDQYLPYARPTPVLADYVRVQHELMWGGRANRYRVRCQELHCRDRMGRI